MRFKSREEAIRVLETVDIKWIDQGLINSPNTIYKDNDGNLYDEPNEHTTHIGFYMETFREDEENRPIWWVKIYVKALNTLGYSGYAAYPEDPNDPVLMKFIGVW